jgi:predicted amidohydrolase YtcJ
MSEIPRTADIYGAADRVLLGGNVLTLDGLNRRASAVAIRGGRILALGEDREIVCFVGRHTDVVDLAGATALPGFIETHTHPLFYGMTLAAPVDAGTPPNDTIGDIVERVAAAAEDVESGGWIRGYRYDDTLLRDNRHPTRDDLDPAPPRHPVCLQHVSGHFCAINSVALDLMGISRETPDPPGGVIVRDERGEPTGVLAETAAFDVYARMPVPGPDEMDDYLGLAGDSYLSNGVTTVHDTGVGLLGGFAELPAYQRAIRSGRFRSRVLAYLVQDLFPNLASGVLSPVEAGVAGLGDEQFRLAGVKFWADGSIQGLTGALHDGYACAPDKRGLLIFEPDDLARRVATLHAAGWQLAIHGNGDAAIQTILDAYTRIGLRPQESDRRHRIEHCQMVQEDQLDTMAEAGVLASFFVKHVYYWGDRHRDIFIGPERAARISPLASATSRGLRFGLHSDTPVVPVSPLEGIWCAVQRVTRDGNELGPEQRVDVETALRGYTSDAAYLGFEEDTKGVLEPGRLADITVLSGDPTAVEPEQIRTLSVDATIVGGDVAWRRPSSRPRDSAATGQESRQETP